MSKSGWQPPETAPEGELVWIAYESPHPHEVLYDSARLVISGRFKRKCFVIGRVPVTRVFAWMTITPYIRADIDKKDYELR